MKEELVTTFKEIDMTQAGANAVSFMPMWKGGTRLVDKLFFREKLTLVKIEWTGDYFQGVWLTQQQMQCSFCQCGKEGKDWCSKEKKMEKVGEEQKKRRPLFAGLSWLPLSTGILAILICVVTWVQTIFWSHEYTLSINMEEFSFFIYRDEWIVLALAQKEK